jgi:hypothetical protein
VNTIEESFLVEAIKDAGAHFGGVIHLMVNGVAFPKIGNTKEFTVMSHEGEELGELSRADVEYAIAYMKRRGRKVGKVYMGWYAPNKRQQGDTSPAFTFAWEDWWIAPRHRPGYGEVVKQNFLRGLV